MKNKGNICYPKAELAKLPTGGYIVNMKFYKKGPFDYETGELALKACKELVAAPPAPPQKAGLTAAVLTLPPLLGLLLGLVAYKLKSKKLVEAPQPKPRKGKKNEKRSVQGESSESSKSH